MYQTLTMKTIITLFALLFFVALQAQYHSGLQGKITDSETGDAPMAFAQISLNGTSISSESDLNGEFSITDIAPGNYEIKIAFPGYQTVRKPITITEKETVSLDITMRALVLAREEVIQAH